MIRTSIKASIILTSFILTFSLIVFLSNNTEAYNYGTQTYGECLYGGEIGATSLTFTVNTTLVALGALSTSSVTTGSATFDVVQRCSNLGYVVTANGTTPTNGSHNLTNLPSTVISTAGVEQFGINLVSNSSPSVGANPSGGSGAAATGYATTNQFKYVSGDIIASASPNSTNTTYTISYIANASNVTPTGSYSGIQTLICTATY